MAVMLRERWESAEQYVEFLTHWAAYVLFAREFIVGRRVLEIGCGMGYGTDYLAEFASCVTAVDISGEHISHCQDKYGRDGITFLRADGIELPFKDNTFDVVLSFQVMEHIEPRNVLDYFSEIRRVLRRGGVVLVSTPNRRKRLLPLQKPWNPEHKREYDDSNLENLLERVFGQVKISGLCGSEDIVAIEYGWRKQTLLRVYVMYPIYRIMGFIASSSMLIRLRRVAQRLLRRYASHEQMPQEIFVRKFSLSDFRIDSTCTRDCIDLYGIGNKAGARY
ncbi:MAG: hypothetical protein A2Y72_01000 [Chloroflexi bacterium RBG_13_53_26]|nr:MAG: hypothetical protein A2Y72_01000 [Chloroflexi bacterium RBG_13_53_26]